MSGFALLVVVALAAVVGVGGVLFWQRRNRTDSAGKGSGGEGGPKAA